MTEPPYPAAAPRNPYGVSPRAGGGAGQALLGAAIPDAITEVSGRPPKRMFTGDSTARVGPVSSSPSILTGPCRSLS